jgi:hypothetical protein
MAIVRQSAFASRGRSSPSVATFPQILKRPTIMWRSHLDVEIITTRPRGSFCRETRPFRKCFLPRLALQVCRLSAINDLVHLFLAKTIVRPGPLLFRPRCTRTSAPAIHGIQRFSKFPGCPRRTLCPIAARLPVAFASFRIQGLVYLFLSGLVSTAGGRNCLDGRNSTVYNR